MRTSRLSVVAVVGVLMAGCGGEATEAKPPVAPPPPAPVETAPTPVVTASAEPAPAPPEPKKSLAELQVANVRNVFDAWSTKDAKKLLAGYTDDCKVLVSGLPEISGKEALQAYAQKNWDAFSGLKLAPWRTFQKGDMMVIEWVATGTHSGEFMGVKGSDKAIGNYGVSLVWTNADGLVKEQHDYYDVPTILSQVGVSKQPARPVAKASESPEMHAAKASPDEDKNPEMAKTMYGAFEKKSEADFIGGLADTVEYEDYARPAAMKGKGDAKKLFASMMKAFPDLKVTPTNVLGVEDFVIVEGTIGGTHKGALGPIAATKKPFTSKFVDIFQYKDGKTVRAWSYSNSGDMMAQLGVLKMPAAAKAAEGSKGEATPAGDKKGDVKKPEGAGAKADTPKAEAKKGEATTGKADAGKADAKKPEGIGVKADAGKADAKKPEGTGAKADAPKADGKKTDEKKAEPKK